MNLARSRTRYYPPAQDVLVRLAQEVGSELGGDHANWEVVQGLAGFVGMVARVLANDLNRKLGTEFDSRIE
jgi:hypothetical protein